MANKVTGVVSVVTFGRFSATTLSQSTPLRSKEMYCSAKVFAKTSKLSGGVLGVRWSHTEGIRDWRSIRMSEAETSKCSTRWSLLPPGRTKNDNPSVLLKLASRSDMAPPERVAVNPGTQVAEVISKAVHSPS